MQGTMSKNLCEAWVKRRVSPAATLAISAVRRDSQSTKLQNPTNFSRGSMSI